MYTAGPVTAASDGPMGTRRRRPFPWPQTRAGTADAPCVRRALESLGAERAASAGGGGLWRRRRTRALQEESERDERNTRLAGACSPLVVPREERH